MLYYIHGYQSNCETAKALLAKSLGAECIHYENKHIETGEVLDMISKIGKDDDVIGSSLGGLLAMYTPAKRKFLLNPLMNPDKMVKINRKYNAFVERAKKKKMQYTEIYTFLGKNDKVLKHNIGMFYKISRELLILDDDHRFSKKRDFVFYYIERVLSNI